jgi:hypothetical protein
MSLGLLRELRREASPMVERYERDPDGLAARAMNVSKRKIDAIFELREAAEKKALAEIKAADQPTLENRDELLETRLTLEDKTVAAIEACHECGHEHAPNASHGC